MNARDILLARKLGPAAPVSLSAKMFAKATGGGGGGPVSPVKDGLIAEWMFLDNLTDTSGNGNDFVNHVQNISYGSGVGGSITKSAIFNQSFAQANNGVLPSDSPWTISVWLKMTGANVPQEILGTALIGTDGGNVAKGVQFLSLTQARYYQVRLWNGNIDPRFLSKANGFTLNTWEHHIIIFTNEVSTNGLRSYKNKGLMEYASVPSSHTHIDGTQYNFFVGGAGAYSGFNYDPTKEPYYGEMAALRIFNRVLTNEEIALLYAEGHNE